VVVDNARSFYRAGTTLPTRTQVSSLKLQAPAVDPFVLDRILANSDVDSAEVLSRVASEIDRVQTLPRGPFPRGTPEISKLTLCHDDLTSLKNSQIIRCVSKREIHRHNGQFGTAFSVVEIHKNRRRFIYWPKSINSCEELDKIVPELQDVVSYAQLPPNQWAAQFDIKASFYQYELPEAVKWHFAFEFEGSYYIMERLPMGFRLAPALMQAVSKCLVSKIDSHADVHIDNTRFVGTQEEVTRCSVAYRKVCTEAGVTLNDDPLNKPHQRGEFCGLQYDYAHSLVTITQKLRDKLQSWSVADISIITLTDMQSLYGLLYFASRVLRLDIWPFYQAVKCYRRKMSASRNLPPAACYHTPANIWPSVIPFLKQWLQQCLSAQSISHFRRRPDASLRLVVDASTKGWGATIFHNGTFTVAMGKWPCEISCSQINEHEVLAAVEAFKAFGDSLSNVHILLAFDNTSAIASMHKMLPQAEQLAAATNKLKRLIPESSTIKVEYISTSANPADEPSRGKAVVPEKLLAWGRSVGRVARSHHSVVLPRRDFCPHAMNKR
jgi:hypothetical protein